MQLLPNQGSSVLSLRAFVVDNIQRQSSQIAESDLKLNSTNPHPVSSLWIDYSNITSSHLDSRSKTIDFALTITTGRDGSENLVTDREKHLQNFLSWVSHLQNEGHPRFCLPLMENIRGLDCNDGRIPDKNDFADFHKGILRSEYSINEPKIK